MAFMQSGERYAGWARTKIVATVGPACREPEQLGDLVLAGADVFRLNMAHGGPEAQQPMIDRIRELSDELNQPLAILVDLAGPKIRLGEIAGGMINCNVGDEFFFVSGAPMAPNELTSTYKPLVGELAVGNLVMLADGAVAMKVTEIAGNRARARVVAGGVIRSRQGINLPGVKLSAPAIGLEDRTNALWAAQASVDYVSLSFVRSAAEVSELKELLRRAGQTPAWWPRSRNARRSTNSRPSSRPPTA